MTNGSPRAYREVSVTSVNFSITRDNLLTHFLGRECYRRTRTIVVRNGDDVALVSVEPVDPEPLFSPAARVEVMSLPSETVFVQRPDVDTGIPSQLAAVALQFPGARAVVVEGRYSHVSFLFEPRPIVVRVREVVPPHPAKLLDQAQRVLNVSEDLMPIVLEPELHDLAELSSGKNAVLLPCRGSGIEFDGRPTYYLDERPAHHDWELLGCSRSRQIHSWFYGVDANGVDTCPRALSTPGKTAGLLLTKCCLLEDRVEEAGDTVVVPWGATLEQVREALGLLALRAEAAWSPG
jgi:hypothetical protein